MRNRWTKDEEKRVLTRAAELRRSEPELTVRDSLYRGQDAIDEARRKKEFTAHYQKALLARLQALEQKQRSLQHNQTVTAAILAAEPPAPPPAPAPSLNELLAEKLRELGTTFAEVIANALAPALVVAVAKLQPAQPPVPMEHAIAHPGNGGNGGNGHGALDQVENKLPEKFKVHKIAVLPLNNTQQQELKSRFPHLDIRFLTNDNKAQQIEQVTKHCEATFVMTRFVAHKTERAVSGEHPMVRVNGGMTELSRLIESRFPKSTSMDVTH